MARCGTRLLMLTAFASSVALFGSPAFGQAPPPEKPAAKAESTDPMERARVHYERGLQLFNEENYDAALFEFDRAYELAPSYKILYNMGRIQRQQNNYAAAMRSYTRYLREGGAAVPAERRKEVEGEIALLKPRVAHVKVTVNVDAADVYADDIPVCTATIESSCVGKSPLQAPIIVNGGRHKITATKKGYAPATALVSVVGSDEIDVKLELVTYDRPVAPLKNPYVVPMFVGVGVTTAGLITTTILGVLTSTASKDQDERLNKFGASSGDLTQGRSKVRELATFTTGFGIGTGVALAVTGYLVIRAVSWKGTPAPTPTTTGGIRVNELGVVTF